jgi:hypothetical protein
MGDVLDQDFGRVWVQRPESQARESTNEAVRLIHMKSGTRFMGSTQLAGGALRIGAITGSGWRISPVVYLGDGHRAAHAPGFPEILPFPSDPFPPPKYLEPWPSPRERPKNTKAGNHVTES